MTAKEFSIRELLYLSAPLKIESLWGFDDRLREKETAEMRHEVPAIQDSLRRKKLLQDSADGALLLSQACEELLELCRNSKKMYVLDSSAFEAEGTRLRYFDDGREIVRFQCRERAILAPSNKELMRAEILGLFEGKGSAEQATDELETGIARLRRMGSLSKPRFVEELKNSGCKEELAGMIADILQGDPEFCSILVYERSAQSEALAGKLVLLTFQGQSLLVTADADMDSVRFCGANYGRMTNEIDKIVGTREEVEIV